MRYADRVRRTKTSAEPVRRQLRQQLAWAAGVDNLRGQDPAACVTEDFQQTFDRIGRQHAATVFGEAPDAYPQTDELHGQRADDGQTAGQNRLARQPQGTDAGPFYEMRDGQRLMQRFSEIAFRRGTMAGAVLNGTGRMMLVSCLKRTLGQSQPVKMQQRRLFAGASQHRLIPGHDRDMVVFNRGFAQSAVGLVVDTLADARNVVDSLTALAEGQSDMGAQGGAETLRRMYPFLSDQRERQLLETYRTRLRDTEDDEERHLLQNALVHTQALVDRKAQMRNEWIGKLRQIADRAIETLTMFETPGFSDALMEEIEQDMLADGSDLPDDADAGGADAAERSQADSTAGSPDPEDTEPETAW